MTLTFKTLTFPAIILWILCSSCKKRSFAEEQISITAPDTTKTVLPPMIPISTVKTYLVGTGSGNLIVDGTTMDLKCNEIIKIQPGTYNTITIKNINLGCPINVQNNGLVETVGNGDHWMLTNVSNLKLSGSGTSSISKGFVSRDNPQHRSIIITGKTHDLTIENFAFKNVLDFVVFFVYSPENYVVGNDKTYDYNLKFLNIDCDNTGSLIQMDGGVDNGNVTGLVKNLEIANLSFKNSNCGNVIYVGNADDYNIHNNTISDINSTNNNHNGIFTIKGSGAFHHNLIKNHQGNAIRAWARSLGTTPKEILIYNNTVVNSRKYSAFEVQSFNYEIIAGKTSYTNVKVYNNICGDLNLSKDWVGVILDVYSLEGGKCEVYNNTGFNFPAPNVSSLFVNTQANQASVLTNNLYFNTAKDAGVDVTNLTIQK